MEIPRHDDEPAIEPPAFVEPPRRLFLNPDALESGWIWDDEAEEGFTCSVDREGRAYELSEFDVGRPPETWLPWVKPGAADTDTVEDTAAELSEADRNVEIAQKLRALADLAEKECSPETLALARQEFREWMRIKGVGKPMEALAARLKELGPATERSRGLVAHAALALLDEGRADRAEVPTQDAPNGVGDGKGKGKRAKKAPKPPKSKRSTSFVKKLGVNVAVYKLAFAPDDVVLLKMLREGGYDTADVVLRESPAYGFCPIDDLAGTTKDLEAVPTIGADPEFRVWALKVAHKKGCPTHAFRAQAERQALTECSGAEPSKKRIAEIVDDLRSRWCATATPHLDLVPVTYHRPSMTFAIHGGNAEAKNAALNRLRKLGGLERVDDTVTAHRQEARRLNLGRTALRAQDAQGVGEADLGADALLWLVGRNLGGTAAATVGKGGEHRLEWWLDSAIGLERPTADEKRLTVRLGGAPAEGGSLAGALGDGASIQSLQLGLRLDGSEEQVWKVSLSRTDTGLEVGAWKHPTRCKPDGTPAGLDAAIDDRLRTWLQGLGLLEEVLGLFVRERLDVSGWRQRAHALQRLVLGGIDDARAKFIAATGQVALFAEQLAEHVEGANAEPKRKPGESRGRAARAAAGKPSLVARADALRPKAG